MSFIDCEAAAIESDDFAVHLAGALSKFRSLKSFESHLNPKMAHKVLASLAGHKELERIHLRSDVILGKKSSPALSAVLRGKPKLSSVTLELRSDDCNYMFGERGFSAATGMLDDDGIAALSSGLCGKNAVKDLELIGNKNIGRRGWSAFSTALKSSRSVLETLKMPINCIGDDGAILIANALAKNSALRVIDLAASTGITARGWRAFCAVFESEDSVLETLSLWDCRFDADVYISWANSLANNNSLKVLDVTYGTRMNRPGMNLFRGILCNGLSIMDTFLSNHTLEAVSAGRYPELDRLLKINKESNTKFDAAREKTILHHSTECLEIFKGLDAARWAGGPGMDAESLPFALAWMGRRTGGSDDGPDAGSRFERGSSMLYDFVRAMPGLFEGMNAGDRKRKRE